MQFENHIIINYEGELQLMQLNMQRKKEVLLLINHQ